MKILFISNINSMNSKASSTDIMTYNIIYGLSKVCNSITLVAINDFNTDEDKKEIIIDFKEIAKKTYVVKSKLRNNSGKYSYLFGLFKKLLFYKCDNNFDKIISEIDDDTILITQSPSLESILLCRKIKKKFKNIRWIQYWSDPIALGGINPEKVNIKRMPYYFIEKRCLKYASKIVYGTKVLYKYQAILYKKYSDVMSYVDVAYKISDKDEINDSFENKRDFLYAGNFFKYTRNIEPLYKAFENSNNNHKLVIYGNGDQFCSSRNIVYNKRISPNELKNVEKGYKNIVCLMNSKCIQIPGKTFYDIYSKKNILVIVDGSHKKEIVDYLKSYKRFVIVNNDVDSIISGINKINKFEFELNNIKKNYSPEKIALDIVS